MHKIVSLIDEINKHKSRLFQLTIFKLLLGLATGQPKGEKDFGIRFFVKNAYSILRILEFKIFNKSDKRGPKLPSEWMEYKRVERMVEYGLEQFHKDPKNKEVMSYL